MGQEPVHEDDDKQTSIFGGIRMTRAEKKLELRFEEAQAEAVKKIRESTSEDIKNELFAYYRQAKEGDVGDERPTRELERARYDAWFRIRGMPKKDAIERYITAVRELDSTVS